jgi:hypothetical protein
VAQQDPGGRLDCLGGLAGIGQRDKLREAREELVAVAHLFLVAGIEPFVEGPAQLQ